MSGNSLINFKNLIAKRKKSAPDTTEPLPITSTSLVANENKHDELLDDDLIDECNSRQSVSSLNTTGPLSTYMVYLNENCCIELAVTQKGSNIQNIITEVIVLF